MVGFEISCQEYRRDGQPEKFIKNTHKNIHCVHKCFNKSFHLGPGEGQT